MHGVVDTHLYFMGPECGPCEPDDATLIKIGRSIHPEKRLAAIQANCPIKLSLWDVFEFAGEVEPEIHAVLSQERSHGEWFAYSERLERVREVVRETHGDEHFGRELVQGAAISFYSPRHIDYGPVYVSGHLGDPHFPGYYDNDEGDLCVVYPARCRDWDFEGPHFVNLMGGYHLVPHVWLQPWENPNLSSYYAEGDEPPVQQLIDGTAA